jgi:hypothetical protein
MIMKKLLLAGIGAAAFAAAGSASALTLSGTVGGVSATTADPYTIASETKLANLSAAVATSLDIFVVSGTVNSGTFVVTYTITNASFTGTPTLTLKNSGGAVSTLSTSTISSNSGSSISFVVTVGSGGTQDTLKDFVLNSGLVLGQKGTPVFTTGNIKTDAGNQVDNSGGSLTLIDFATGFASVIGAGPTVIAKLPDFKTLTSNTLGTGSLGLKAYPAVGAGGPGIIYNNLAGTPIAAGDITGDQVVVVGDASTLQMRFGSTSPANTAAPDGQAPDAGSTTTTTIFTTPFAGGFAGLSFGVYPKSPAVAILPSTYTGQINYALDTTKYDAPAAASPVALASIILDGTNFLAPWVGDGANGNNYQIRLANGSAVASGTILLTLRAPASTPTATTCSTSGIPANGEKTIDSALLASCFGSFKRGDVLVTVQSPLAFSSVAPVGSVHNFSAKLRVNNAGSNVATEYSLGDLGSGGVTVFGAQPTAAITY